MKHVKERIASAVVAGAIGLVIALLMIFWISVPTWAFVVVPLACAVAGFAAGDKAIEAFKHIASWV